jgi:hypothetical protein
MLTLTLYTLVLIAQPAPTAQPRPAGFRTKLAFGELFIQEGMRAADEPIDLLVHLHGSAELMERNLQQSGLRAVLVTVSLNGLSSVYTKQFREPESFLSLVDEATTKTGPPVGANGLVFRRVILSSFSAGFGGVRELLKSPDCYQRIDAIVMADSIYSGYLGDSRDRGVDPDLMQGFLRFAEDAVANRKQMTISYCQLQPDGYASTEETADYLIRKLMLQPQPCDEMWSDQWHCRSKCERSGLHLFGFTGTEGVDHMRHLRNIGRFWKSVAK